MPAALKTPSFPPSGRFLEAVRSSSRSVRLAYNIQIRPEPIERLLRSETSITVFKPPSHPHGLLLPLKFPSVLAELNVISILSLLNFGSGYDIPLKKATGRGAWDTIRALVLSLHLTSSVGGEGDFLSARGMQAITIHKVAESLGVRLHEEKPHGTIPGLTVGVLGGPIYEFVKLVTDTMNETGQVLVGSGYPNIGSFVLEAVRDSQGAKEEDDADASADFILERLVRAIPAFQDMAVVDAQPIYCFRNALFLLHAIDMRFNALSPPPLPIPSTAHISFFADAVICSILIYLGLIDLTSSAMLSSTLLTAEQISSTSPSSLVTSSQEYNDIDTTPITSTSMSAKEGAILTISQAYVLRAASIDTCELIVETARSRRTGEIEDDGPESGSIDMTAASFDGWMRTVAKDKHDYASLLIFPRGSVFF